MYEKGIFKRTQSSVPSIVVGNIRVGGTGKSPMVLFLAKSLIEKGIEPAILSRGYGRNTKGFIEVLPNSTALQCGDEPLMIKRKMPELKVFVCENRVDGISRIKQLFPQTKLVLLDDAFQHFRLKADFYILLTEWAKPFFKDFPLPAGMLREFASSAKRADFVITTKTPFSVSDSEKQNYLKSLSAYTKSPHCFASLEYENPIQISSMKQITWDELKQKELIVLTGIANPQPLLEFLNAGNIRYHHLKYGDHTHFSDKKLKQISSEALQKDCFVLTTEKDFARFPYEIITGWEHWYYVPVQVAIANPDNLLKSLYSLVNP